MSGSIADIKSIFGRALELQSPAEREAFLAKACAGDAALRAEVESLLQAGLGAGDFLEDLRPAPDTTLYQTASERPGDVIGPYRLLEQIGEGGFGAVYMAEQLEPVRRKVAVKLLKPGMEARQVIARFEAERQALALMDHPNIAKVHDGGTTPAGRPYFVMELVRGTPISEHCDREQLTMRPRLELFIQVCMAVQHAHQKGIIHRDLKPSNVLVAMHDGAPVAKVIDFGVAKALGAELTDKTLFTGLAQMIGTPLYMSPEQAGRDGLDVDTRSDIYSLGVLLYELLTGTTPISKDRFKRAAFEEIRRIIREEDPPKPSTRLTESTDSLPSISAVRGTEPARLTKSLRGDLDWIAMKALEKNRERRYESAAGFALDIQRYLANEPVSAGPPSAWYRLRKFARRNRGSLAFAALAGAAAALAVIGLTVNHRMVSREKGEKEAALERVTEEKKRADENLATARRAVNQYLHRAVDDPLLKTADFQKLRKGLLEATLPFYQEFVRQRHEDPELERERGQAFLDLSMLRGALGEQARALEDALAAERLFGALARVPAAQPAIRNDWAGAIMTRGILLEEATRFSEAEDAFREALAIVEPLAAANADPRFRIGVAKIRNNLGDLLRQVGRHDEAESELNRSVQVREGLVAEFPERLAFRHDLAKSWLNLGAARADRRKPADAEMAFTNAIAALDSKPEAETNDRESWSAERWLTLSRAHNNLGMLQRAAGRNAEAEASFKSALDVKEKLADAFPSMPQHRRELANAVNSLGVLQGDVGRGRDAEASFERAVRIYERLAAEFPAQASHLVDMAGSCKNLGQQIGDDGRLEESLVWLTKGIDALEPVVRRDPAFVKARSSSCLSHWARATSLCGLMRYQEGVRDWSRAIELDDGRYRDSLRLKRASANLNLNDRARVAEDAGAVAGSPAATAEDLLVAAALLAQCATPAAADGRAAEGSAASALSALRKAKAKGLEGPKQIMEGSAFESLKARPDFQKFIKEWEAEASPPKKGDMPP